jgi:hypothetical protein
MKTVVQWSLALVAFFTAPSFPASAQGTFQNLDFESANVSPSGPEPYGTFVPIGSALPGWTAYLGAGQLTQVGYNSPTIGTATISVMGPTWNSSDTGLYGIGIIDGNYSVILQSGIVPGSTTVGENASIAQNGTVPSTAESLEFEAVAVGPFSVSFVGNPLDPIALSSGQGEDGQTYILYGANISAWAGQTGELEFTADYNVHDPYLVLDDITFSTQSVPEPGVISLLGIGGLAFAFCGWHRRPKS